MYPIAWNVARVFRKNPALGLMGLLLTGCWADPVAPRSPAPPARPVVVQPPEVMASEFGTVNEDGVVTPAAEIPLHDGSLFGWRIKLPRCEEVVDIREELQLPGVGDWDPSEGMVISKDRQTAIVHSGAECHDGWIAKIWSVATSDPPGEWVLRVHVKGYAPVTFSATFTPPPPPASP